MLPWHLGYKYAIMATHPQIMQFIKIIFVDLFIESICDNSLSFYKGIEQLKKKQIEKDILIPS